MCVPFVHLSISGCTSGPGSRMETRLQKKARLASRQEQAAPPATPPGTPPVLQAGAMAALLLPRGGRGRSSGAWATSSEQARGGRDLPTHVGGHVSAPGL